MNIVMLLYPGVTQLDLTGPWEVLRRLSDVEVHLAWKTLEAVRADGGMGLLPTTALDACPQADVLLVPGGPGQIALMEDDAVLDWVRRQGEGAQWVTAVCTGSLILGAAGLLRGYRAACHWMSRSMLARLGARPAAGRIVLDGNRITGGGVTAGIDLALELAALLRSEREARLIGLQIEYDPAPPFGSGSPENAELELILEAERRAKPMLKARREGVERARARLGL